MKALKEKRISLRSLWRMGLVVLSVFALAFAACGDSDSGSSGTPGTQIPGNVAGGPVPTAITVEAMPLESTLGPVHEGQLVSLAGIQLNVRYSDSSLKPLTDPSKLSVSPTIYIFGQSEYTLTYTDNGRALTVPIYFPNVRRLIDLDVTGQMNKQRYRIDDQPDYTGLTVFGVYSEHPADNDPYKKYPEDRPANWDSMPGYYRRVIPLDISNPDYKWAWVNNRDPGTGSFINDNPGVLIAMGSYGHILSKIEGANAPYAGGLYGYYGNDYLQGKRIEITQLYQVSKIELNEGTWPKIFYDDPTLISAVKTETELATRMSKWVDSAFQGATLKVTYTGGDPIELPLRDWQTKNYVYADTVSNIGWGGTWANLEVFPVSRAGYRIDVKQDNKAVLGGTDNLIIKDFNWLEALKADDYDYDAVDPESEIVRGTIVGDGGWAQWAQLAYPRSNMRFYWRGYHVDVPVPIYNRPVRMEVKAAPGEATPIVMRGHDFVYQRPDGMKEYLSKVIVTVVYTKQGDTTNKEEKRDNVAADIAAGTCRGFIDFTTNDGVAMRMPSLYTETIYNWSDKAPAGATKETAYLYDVYAAQASQSFENDLADLYGNEGVLAKSALTKANSDNYTGARNRTVRGRIYYRGWAGNPGATRQVSNSDIQVGPVGYAVPVITAP